MNFEEEFPSLKGKRIDEPDCEKCSHSKIFSDEVIQENCIDKQKVRDVIDNFVKKYSGLPICINLANELKKELKL